MKKIIIFVLIVAAVFSLTSCEQLRKELRSTVSYKDPETIGGYWDITTQTGQEFKHVICSYWGTTDDTACFVTDDGALIFQSGAITCIRSK